METWTLESEDMSEIFESKPRFNGCPPICLKTNLPSFKDPEDAKAWHEKTNPRGMMKPPWPCTACGGWHYRGIAADPGGSTSGTTRTQKHFGEGD